MLLLVFLVMLILSLSHHGISRPLGGIFLGLCNGAALLQPEILVWCIL